MKRVMSLLLILVLTLSFVACGNEDSAAEKMDTPEALMDEVMENAEENTNAEFNANFALEMSGLEELEMFGPMTLEMTGKMKDAKNMMMELAVDAGIGLSIEGSLFINEEKMLIHLPLLNTMLGMGYDYMQLSMSDVTDLAGSDLAATQDADKIMAVLERFQEETDNSIYDILVLNEKMPVEKIEINDKKVETTKLSMTVSTDGAIDMIYAFMAFIAEDEEAKALLLAEMSQEDIDTMLEEMADPATREEMEEVLEMIDIETFAMDYYINSNFDIVKMVINADLSMENEGEVLDVKLSGEMERFNFGDVKSIDMPDVTDDQIMNLTDMIDPSMFEQ